MIYFTEQGLLSEPLKKKGLKNNKEKIRIDFSIANSSNGSYSVQAKLYDRQVLDYFSETKQSFIKQDINFEKFFTCDFIFEKQQDIVITLKKNDEEIKINTTLGGIIGSRDSKVIYKYAGDESFIIKAKKLGNYEDLLDVKFILKEDNQLGKNNFFVKNKFYYFITCNNKKVYKSSFITKDGTFENIYIPTCLLQPLYSVYFYNSFNQPIFHFNNSIKNIKSNQKIQLKIPFNNKTFYLEDKSVIIKNFSLTDYINSGIKIALSIGIDFTSSNGNPFNYGTLHSIRGNTFNDYEKAIYSCGNIVAKYDYDQIFPVYGFGAIINHSNNNNPKCFNLNFSDNPDISSINNVIKCYRDCILGKKLTFSGPNNFAPLIKKVLSRIKKNDIFEYHILMILTNGIINDLQPTIDSLVEASSYPLSVIIIGIGTRDFKKMKILDGDEIPLISSTGQKWKRDLVQFVPFSKFQSDEKKLAMEVLAEIPRQIVEFYRCNNLNPIQIKEQNIKRSFNSQFVSNNDYFFNNKNFKITRSMSNKAPSRNQTGINFNQNIQTTRNTYNNPINQISIKSNTNSINNENNNKLKNKPLSSTKRALQHLNQNNPNQNNQFEFSNNYTNNMLANANTFNIYNQSYSDSGGIYTQGNNLNNNFNNNQTVPNISQSQGNYSNMPNPFHTNPMNNNNNSISHSYNNNSNNFSNNIINIYNNGNNSNNPQYSNITAYMNNLPLHETKKLSKK